MTQGIEGLHFFVSVSQLSYALNFVRKLNQISFLFLSNYFSVYCFLFHFSHQVSCNYYFLSISIFAAFSLFPSAFLRPFLILSASLISFSSSPRSFCSFFNYSQCHVFLNYSLCDISVLVSSPQCSYKRTS